LDTVTIALDAMGGDHGVEAVVPAALEALRRHPRLELVLVGDRDAIAGSLPGDPGPRLTVRHTSQTVGMDESPALALRNKKDSSMRVAIDLVKEGRARACVSAGNTGALMATARFVLRTLPGIERPAIITALPTMAGHVYVLDLGANVDVAPRHLVQFAVMGSVLVSAVDENPAPRVGLLNIGEEAIKGNERVKEAARLLEVSNLNYTGYVEGDDIYVGRADVVVCDGFVGNVALKASEGVAHMLTHFLKVEFGRNLLTKLSGLIAMPVLRALRQRLDPRRYNGASLLGLKGIVVKSHGGADAYAFGHAIDEAVKEVAKDVPTRIESRLAHYLDAEAAEA
jgi:glycerol-3-phosphate acyltransferase PlsX